MHAYPEPIDAMIACPKCKSRNGFRYFLDQAGNYIVSVGVFVFLVALAAERLMPTNTPSTKTIALFLIALGFVIACFILVVNWASGNSYKSSLFWTGHAIKIGEAGHAGVVDYAVPALKKAGKKAGSLAKKAGNKAGDMAEKAALKANSVAKRAVKKIKPVY